MKIIVDMNLSPRWADFLSQNGFEAIIRVRVADLDPELTAIPIIRLLRQNTDEIEQGVLVTIDESKTRLHILPFA